MSTYNINEELNKWIDTYEKVYDNTYIDEEDSNYLEEGEEE